MTALRKILERMKSWRLWAIVVIVVAVGAGGYYAFTTWSDSSAEEEAAQTQLVPVTRGDLVNDVSVTGTLTYTTRETITFGQQGFVSDVTVSEGDRVSAGDAIAVLDAETVANLEKAVAQARIDVRNAEDALEEARNPYTAAQIAKAESDVANARLEKAEEAYSDLGVVSEDTLAQARIDILNAQADLEAAQESKVTLVKPTFQEVVNAQSRVTAARVALQDARDDLDALLNPTDGDIAAAEADVTKARLDLEVAREALDALSNVTEIDLAKAHAAVADAQLDLEMAQAELDKLTNPTAVDLAKAKAAVADAQLDFEAAQEAVDEATTPATAENIADYQADIDSAQNSLLTAQFRLQAAQRNAEEEIQAVMDDLDEAQGEYSALFEKWLGMNVAQPFDQSPDAAFAALGSDLATIFEGPHIDRMRSLFEQGIL